MANETKPRLYTYQGDQYDYNTFSRDANAGFSDYISQFDFNNDERQYIWDAYSNLLSGIGDGSIIYNNGRLKDLRGRYSNNYYYNNKGERKKSKGANDDYYGLATNYLLGVLGRQQKYETPVEEKPIWDDVTRQSDLSQLIFNTDNPTDAQLKYFIDTDSLVNGTRGVSERTKIIANALSKYYTKENLLSRGASEEDATKYSQWAQEAIQRLNDGKIDAGDTYALSRLLPGYDLDALFRSEQKSKEQIEREQSESRQRELDTQVKQFEDYWNNNFSSPSGTSRDFTLNKINLSNEMSNTYLAYDKLLNSVDTDTLYKVLLVAFNNPTYDFSTYPLFKQVNYSGVKIPTDYIMSLVLSKLEDKGLITKEGELTGLLDNNFKASYVWDKQNHKLKRIPLSESKYWREKIFTNFTGKKPKQDNTWINDLFVQYQKKGGVLKAQNGIKYEDYYENPEDAITYTSNLAGIRYKNVLGEDNNWTTQQRQNPSTNNNNPNDLLYDPELGNPEERSFWNDWVKYLTSNKDLAKRWAEGYMSLQQDPKIKNEILRQWNDDNGFNFEKFKQSITRDGVTKQLWNDKINGIGHDFYIGDVYRIKGENGQPDRYYKGIVDGYSKAGEYTMSDNGLYRIYDISKDAITPGPTLPNIPKPDIPEINVKPKNNPSTVTPTKTKTKDKSQTDWTGILGNLGTDLMGVGRLFGSLRTNNRVHDTLMDSLNPVLKDTYERYSPITGAFSEMQFRNRQAADLRRRAARPFTSDASLQLAGQLDADRQARDLEYQGFLADDREIKRTQQEALARQEDNIRRRSDVANFNRASINQTNRGRAELDAARLRNNWQSIDNYLSGVESRFRNRLAQRENREYNAGLMLAQNDYQTAIQKYNQKYKKSNPEASEESMLADPKYVRDLQELRNIYQRNIYQLAHNQRYNPQFRVPSSYESVLNRRKGGTLLPSTIMLLNKVIRNESNS